VNGRRDFLTLFQKPKGGGGSIAHPRPPYSTGESSFWSECAGCENKPCVTSCDEGIIIIEAGGSPILNFNKSGCTFCQECALACGTTNLGVLSLTHDHTSHRINARFAIATSGCVAHQGVVCFSCKEPCIEGAILFNGLFNPVIDTDRCTGCGFCLSRCPTQAIGYLATALTTPNEGQI